MIVTQRERERETETQAEGEAVQRHMHREPDVGFDPGSPGSRPGPKAGAKPLRHPGIPVSWTLNWGSSVFLSSEMYPSRDRCFFDGHTRLLVSTSVGGSHSFPAHSAFSDGCGKWLVSHIIVKCRPWGKKHHKHCWLLGTPLRCLPVLCPSFFLSFFF